MTVDKLFSIFITPKQIVPISERDGKLIEFPEDIIKIIFALSSLFDLGNLAAVNSFWNQKVIVYLKKHLPDIMFSIPDLIGTEGIDATLCKEIRKTCRQFQEKIASAHRLDGITNSFAMHKRLMIGQLTEIPKEKWKTLAKQKVFKKDPLVVKELFILGYLWRLIKNASRRNSTKYYKSPIDKLFKHSLIKEAFIYPKFFCDGYSRKFYYFTAMTEKLIELKDWENALLSACFSPHFDLIYKAAMEAKEFDVALQSVKGMLNLKQPEAILSIVNQLLQNPLQQSKATKLAWKLFHEYNIKDGLQAVLSFSEGNDRSEIIQTLLNEAASSFCIVS